MENTENTMPEGQESEVMIIQEKILSFGEILVGIEFNPSNDDKVAKVKQLMAEVANIMKDAYNEGQKSPVKSLLFDHAVGEILNAQMNAVKVITFK
jgi:hypothetical protein